MKQLGMFQGTPVLVDETLGVREAAVVETREPCPFCTSAWSSRLFGPDHPCFTVYDAPAVRA